MLYGLLIVCHVILAVLLMGVVLLQSGRGGGLAGAFGGSGNQTLFGGRGATTFLTKATWILGSGFMVSSLILALTIGNRQATSRPRSVLEENPPVTAPATPGTEQAVPQSELPVEIPSSTSGGGQ